ncbi:hypothetical protein Tco_1346473 [Tanacetum coccineum]
MEFQDIISSSLRKDMKELEGFVRVMDYLELQLATEAVHECNSKKCLTALRKQFDKFLTDTSDCKNEERAFQEYKKGIDVRVSHEEMLWIKEKDVNERRKKETHMIELEILKLEIMTQKGACNITGNAQRAKLSKKKCLIHFRLLHTLLEDFSKEYLTNASFSSGFHRAFSLLFGEDVEYFAPSLMDSIKKAIAERGLYKRVDDSRVNERTMQTHVGMISKDASKIDNNVAGASHDKDNITEDAKVLGLHYVKPDVYDTVEILNDAEESQVKMKEKQFQFNYENINSLYDMFVPQTELSLAQEYFSDPSTSNDSSELSLDESDITDGVKEMLDIFESMERKVDRISKKNAIFQNKIVQLLEANIANDVKNLVMQSYVEIKNNEEIERFQQSQKLVRSFVMMLLKSKKSCQNKLFNLKKIFAKLEAQSLAFEIALQHKTHENNFLKMLQKENENFMTSLQIENAHLKQTYKDLFESVQSSRVETIQCDEVKIKFDFEKIETQNIELEHQIVELEKTLVKQTKENSDLLMKIDNLENAFPDEEKRATIEKLTDFDKDNCDFGLKVDDSKAEKDQFLKEIVHLRTQLENLKGKSVKTKFDKSLILGKPPADKLLITSQLSKSWSTPKALVQKDLSKPVTTQSLPKNEKDQFLKQIAF